MRLPMMLTAVSGLYGCSSFSDASIGMPTSYNVGVGGQTSNSNLVKSIAFNPAETVLLKPGDTVSRTVLVQPAGAYDVSLALLAGSSDASLSDSVVRTNDAGMADFSITASSAPSAFGIRATVGKVNSILSVSVSDSGYAALKVTGNYTGVRNMSEWVATIHNGQVCSDFGNILPDDAALATHSPSIPAGLAIANVPVGPTQSVVLRGDHAVWGCRDVPALASGQTVDIQIQVFDVPATYGADPVPAQFTINTNLDGWASNLSSSSPIIIDAFEQSATSDVNLLLDAMRAATNDAQVQSDFDLRRSSGNWHSVLASQWSSLSGAGDQCIRVALNQWLVAGSNLVTKGVVLDTTLKLIAPTASLGQEQLTLKSMAGYSTLDYTSVTDFPLTTTFGPNDGLAASATITFNDALFLRQLAVTAAQEQYPSVADIPGALASLLQCDGVGVNLDNAAPQSSACDAGCLSQLCSNALTTLWTNTVSASDQRGSTKLNVSCTGTLQVDPNAAVHGYSGTWVGIIASPAGNVLNRGTHRLSCSGEHSATGSGRLVITEPASGAVIAEVPETDLNGVRRAVATAAKVQPDWAAQTPAARAKCLLSWRKAIVNDSDNLTRTLSRENGKPVHEAWLHELAPLCDALTWLAQEAPKLLAEQTITLRWLKQYRSVVNRKPRGQCAIISPYNFPMLIPFADSAAALVAGCSVIVKPSEHTPLTALAIVQLAHASGLEPGLLQVLPGGPSVARTLIESGVDEVIFTGNLEHGREVARLCAESLLPCTLELGGKAPALVLEDVDVDDAASAIVFGALANSGQNCIAVERVLVHTRVQRQLVEAIVDRVRHLRQGDPLLAEVDLGALTSHHHLRHIQSQIDAAISCGAKLAFGGHATSDPGNFITPTVINDCTPLMSIATDETFGPVIPIVPVESQHQALEIANQGQSGLAGYVFGRNEHALQAVARQMNAGHVLLNDVLWSYICPEVPFGGHRNSGWGVVHGAEGLGAHTRPIHTGSPRFKVPESFGLGFPYSKAPRALLNRALRLLTR